MSELHGTCNRRPGFESQTVKVLFPQWKSDLELTQIAYDVLQNELFIQSVSAVMWHGTDVVPCCQIQTDSSNNKGNQIVIIDTTDKSLWAGILLQALLVFTHIVSECEVAGCVITLVSLFASFFSFHFHGGEITASFWTSSHEPFCSAVWYWRLLSSRCRSALSRFCASWLVSWARRIYFRREFLRGRVAAFGWCCRSFVSPASLARLCSHCFWRRSWRSHSWDFGEIGKQASKQASKQARKKERKIESL